MASDDDQRIDGRRRTPPGGIRIDRVFPLPWLVGMLGTLVIGLSGVITFAATVAHKADLPCAIGQHDTNPAAHQELVHQLNRQELEHARFEEGELIERRWTRDAITRLLDDRHLSHPPDPPALTLPSGAINDAHHTRSRGPWGVVTTTGDP